MFDITVNVDALLDWSRYMKEVPQHTPENIARALNVFGDGIVDNAARFISEQTELTPGDVKDLIEIKEAEPDDLWWEMDASALAPPSLDWSRPWGEPDRNKPFDQSTLVKVVTFGDDRVCKVCRDAAADGPFTMAEMYARRVHGYEGGNGLLHENCRCGIKPWSSTRRIPVTFGAGAAPRLFTVKQLGAAVAAAVEMSFRTPVMGGGTGLLRPTD